MVSVHDSALPAPNFYIPNPSEYNCNYYEEHRGPLLTAKKCRDTANKKTNADWSRKYRLTHSELIILRSARKRAKEDNVPFDIEKQDIKIPSHCPILGIELRHDVKHASYNTPSLDRIIPHLAYVKGNILVILNKANRMKSEAKPEELMRVAHFHMRAESLHRNPPRTA